MRTLCHSLTPLPFWPCRERAQGRAFAFFFLPAETVSFDEVQRMKGRMREQSIASYTGNGDCAEQWRMKKGIWGHLMRICSMLNAAYFPQERVVVVGFFFFSSLPPCSAAIIHEYHTVLYTCNYIQSHKRCISCFVASLCVCCTVVFLPLAPGSFRLIKQVW